jgi:sirohydrochlorin cobaltochelatase
MGAPSSLGELLASCLESGRVLIGQIQLGRDFTLRHSGDIGRDGLIRYSSPVEAREIARYDEDGVFRSLKTAPNLKNGWLLEAGSIEGMLQALEFFYPSALALWLAFLRGALEPTFLRNTLDRQTGMYRVTQLLTDDQAQELIACCCSSDRGCLRTILWELAPGLPVTSLPSTKLSLESFPANRIPLICREACNMMVAKARPIAKGNLSR